MAGASVNKVEEDDDEEEEDDDDEEVFSISSPERASVIRADGDLNRLSSSDRERCLSTR